MYPDVSPDPNTLLAQVRPNCPLISHLRASRGRPHTVQHLLDKLSDKTLQRKAVKSRFIIFSAIILLPLIIGVISIANLRLTQSIQAQPWLVITTSILFVAICVYALNRTRLLALFDEEIREFCSPLQGIYISQKMADEFRLLIGYDKLVQTVSHTDSIDSYVELTKTALAEFIAAEKGKEAESLLRLYGYFHLPQDEICEFMQAANLLIRKSNDTSLASSLPQTRHKFVA